jgi:hypothetical protein
LSAQGYVVEEVGLSTPALAADSVLRFAHLSDLHVRPGEKRFERMARDVSERDLDFVFITGDMVWVGEDSWDVMLDMVEQLSARMGVYACRGNWEVKNGSPRLAVQQRLLAERGVRLLVNESETLDLAAGRLRVAGVDDAVLGWPQFEQALTGDDGADYTVLLAHAPLCADMLTGGLSADLVLSGHTHGGQIRVPLLWRAMMPRGAGRYTDGLYDIGDRKLYVSRGFGMAGFTNLRFRCPAEVAVFEVRGR